MSQHPSPGPDTLFARIARGEIPAAKVLETDHALAFLDINPLNPGHTLLIPRAAYPTLADLPDDLAAHLGGLLPRICRAVLKATGADGLNVVVNNGEVAGQTIFHVHWHIIPRHAGDAIRWPWHHSRYEGDALTSMQAAMSAALADEG